MSAFCFRAVVNQSGNFMLLHDVGLTLSYSFSEQSKGYSNKKIQCKPKCRFQLALFLF